MKFSTGIAAAATALLLGATSASALGVSVSGTGNTSFLGVNDFATQLPDDFRAGPLTLTLDTAAILTFTEIAAESGFDNSFLVDGTSVMSETGNFNNFGSGPFPSKTATSYSGWFAAGAFQDRLSFLISPGGTTSDFTFGAGDPGFSVFTDGTSGLTSFFLALDDQNGTEIDDNHDDYIVQVDVAAVPLPAAAWLLLGVSGGLLAAKRRQARKAA